MIYTIVCTHGVSTGAEARQNFRAEWAPWVVASAPDFSLRFVAVPWSSLGATVADGASTLASPDVLEGHLAELRHGFEGSPGLEGVLRESPGPIVWLTHSWGCVLAYLLLARSPWARRVVQLGIGTPHTHQIIGSSLRLRGRAPAWAPGRSPAPRFLANRDDRVCSVASWLPGWGSPRGTRLEWVDHPDADRVGFAREHEPRHYFGSPVFDRLLEGALEDAEAR